MMWIDGVSPLSVLEAFVAAVVAFFIFGIPAAIQQHRFSPIMKDPAARLTSTGRGRDRGADPRRRDPANVIANLKFPSCSDRVPVIGLAVWAVILLTAPLRRPDWTVMPGDLQGHVFLLALVTCASMMPVEELPAASWQTALGLGFVSAVFDNIPLTTLALDRAATTGAFSPMRWASAAR